MFSLRNSGLALLVPAFLFLTLPPANAQSPASQPPASQPAEAAPPTLPQIRKLIDHGQPQQALAALDRLAAAQPSLAGADQVRGLALYALNRFPEADAAFAAALKQDPSDHESAQMRGLTLFRLGRPAEVIPLLESAHEWTADTRIDPSYILALCYLDTRRYDDARRAFALQYNFPPDSASAYLLAARMLFRREYIPVAQQFAHKALDLDPQLPLAHELLGEIALAQEHLDEAIAELELERTRNPLDGAIYDRLGDAYTRSGDYQKAQQYLQQALLLEPNVTGPFILLGKVLLKRQDPINALTYLQHAETMDPSNFITHTLLGQAYRALGRAEDATRETDTAQKIQAAAEPKLVTAH
jgi:tetratricopeptide (TPR) repeat protein